MTLNRPTHINAYAVLHPMWILSLTASDDLPSSVLIKLRCFSFLENLILGLLNCSAMVGIVLDALSVMYKTFHFDALTMYLTLDALS